MYMPDSLTYLLKFIMPAHTQEQKQDSEQETETEKNEYAETETSM